MSSSAPVTVRAARPDDAAAVAAIYTTGIGERTSTFETRPRTAEEMRPRIEAGTHPFLVAVRDGEVVGWAALALYSDRDVYAGIAECSVYVSPNARRQRVGSRLLDALLAEWRGAGGTKALGKLFVTNEASRRLVARCGFREVGTHRRHGVLDGEWRDVLLVERSVSSAAADAPDVAELAHRGVRRNVELKALDPTPERSIEVCRRLGARDEGALWQRDTYYAVVDGRLKLREQDPGRAHLIQYERADRPEQRESRYRIVEDADAATLGAALEAALGVECVVTKQRRLFLWRGVRIHLDRVEQLGTFIELEAVAPPDSDLAAERELVAALREAFAIGDERLVARGYADQARDRRDPLRRPPR